ncbi:hypothetical protein IM538_19415 [Cytobacillus suaedae]|nr:hypothetical protein IM538_19415 [Cytobacillus suaedae]
MKKLWIIVTLLALVGCTEKEVVSGTKTHQKVDNQQLEELKKENESLQKQLNERPNLTSHQLRETMNLALKTLDAMVNKDYTYLESISDSLVTIDKSTNTFHFENSHSQQFLEKFDYSKLEYRFHNLDNNKITVGFALNNGEVLFTFKEVNGQFFLVSFITN